MRGASVKEEFWQRTAKRFGADKLSVDKKSNPTLYFVDLICVESAQYT
jgi:hypothetical protein